MDGNLVNLLKLTALATPCVEDLVGVAQSDVEMAVVTVVVEGAGVISRRVVTVPLVVAVVLAVS